MFCIKSPKTVVKTYITMRERKSFECGGPKLLFTCIYIAFWLEGAAWKFLTDNDVNVPIDYIPQETTYAKYIFLPLNLHGRCASTNLKNLLRVENNGWLYFVCQFDLLRDAFGGWQSIQWLPGWVRTGSTCWSTNIGNTSHGWVTVGCTCSPLQHQVTVLP